MKAAFLCRSLSLLLATAIIYSCQKPVIAEPSLAESSPSNAASQTQTSTTPGDYDMNESSLTGLGWKKVFTENFDNDAFTQWNVWTGGAYNEELQHYQRSGLTVAGGILSITAKKERVTGQTTPWNTALSDFDYTSGRIETKTHFSAGSTTPKVRFSARIKLPTGKGMWPAFWTYGDPWPTQGEIDILEARGNEINTYHTAYWYGRRSGVNTATGTERTITTPSSLSDYWHVYEVVWEQKKLTYYLDGQIVETKVNGEIPNFFRKSQRVTLNLAVGGLFFNGLNPDEIQPGTLQVDWVKVFTSR